MLVTDTLSYANKLTKKIEQYQTAAQEVNRLAAKYGAKERINFDQESEKKEAEKKESEIKRKSKEDRDH